MNFLLPAIAASVMLLAISCDNHKTKDSKATTVQEIQLPDIAAADTNAIPTGISEKQEEEQQNKIPSSEKNIDWDKKIIKNGTLEIEIEDYKKYNTSIHQLVKKWEAYIANEQETSSDYKTENALTIKIPVQYFDEAVQELSTQSEKLLTKQINSQDVTGEYLDTKARMEAKKRIRQRYLDMLQKAKNMGEVLEVEKEINAIQEQIEAAEGRMNYLGHSAAYSTIQLTFFQIIDAKAIDPGNPGFGKRILLAFTDGLKWISELIIVLITLWPLWVGVITGIWVVRKIINAKAKPTSAVN